MKPLDKQIVAEIRDIVTRCYLGKLDHDQRYLYHGTAHCIAGWKQVLDGQNTEAWASGYAKWVWNLTEDEASLLFNAAASFKEQFALIEAWENGERITTFEEYDAFYESLENGDRVPTLPEKPLTPKTESA